MLIKWGCSLSSFLGPASLTFAFYCAGCNCAASIECLFCVPILGSALLTSPPRLPVVCPQVQTGRDAGAAPAGGPHRESSGPVERDVPCKLPFGSCTLSFISHLPHVSSFKYPPSSKRESWKWWEDPRGRLLGRMLLPTSARAGGT